MPVVAASGTGFDHNRRTWMPSISRFRTGCSFFKEIGSSIVPDLGPALLTVSITITRGSSAIRSGVRNFFKVDSSPDDRMRRQDLFDLQQVHRGTGPSQLVDAIVGSIQVEGHLVKDSVANDEGSEEDPGRFGGYPRDGCRRDCAQGESSQQEAAQERHDVKMGRSEGERFHRHPVTPQPEQLADVRMQIRE
jgi:hypothetical protein